MLIIYKLDYNQNLKHSSTEESNLTILYFSYFCSCDDIFTIFRFAYMMMRRYADAIRTFSNSLLYIQKTKQNFQVLRYLDQKIDSQTERY